jgi:RND family efflux transporter MFP subunit
MNSKLLARLLVFVLVAAGFALGIWQLMASAPQSKRERPPAPLALVDVIESQSADFPLTLEAEGPVVSAFELEIRPEVGGKILTLHPDFEPGGKIPAGSTILQLEPDEYVLAVTAAEAEIAKARAALALEKGRRVVAREELDILEGSIEVDAASKALALRKPQLRQVQAELGVAENQLQRAQLDLRRTELRLPYDVLVLERTRVTGEVVAARELVGRVTRADEYWVELRTQPYLLHRLNARSAEVPGSRVTIYEGGRNFPGEVVRIRAELSPGSRLAGVIAAVPVQNQSGDRLLLGSYVRAEIQAGEMKQAVQVPRRAVHDNQRVWVVDADNTLQVRVANIVWESGQRLLLDKGSLQAGDRVVTSRVAGLVPGAVVRSRTVDPDSGKTLAPEIQAVGDD